MFIKIEAERLINLDLIEVIEFRHSQKTVSVWIGGVPVVSDSFILYRYFSKLELEPEPVEDKPVPAPVQVEPTEG